jgi:hypothetical protein
VECSRDVEKDMIGEGVISGALKREKIGIDKSSIKGYK